jgi:hypothetical protein
LRRFRSNQVRLWLSAIAYNLGSPRLWLALPKKTGNSRRQDKFRELGRREGFACILAPDWEAKMEIPVHDTPWITAGSNGRDAVAKVLRTKPLAGFGHSKKDG